MKRAIFAHLDTGGAGLEPNVREAITSLKQATSLPTAS
jgi:formate dehydrogenase subunit delta